MENKIIEYKTALLLKEKGFNVPCLDFYGKSNVDSDFDLFQCASNLNEHTNENNPISISAPTQHLLQKWLRDNHKFHVVVNVGLPHRSKFIGFYSNVIKYNKHHKNKFRSDFFDSYEEALEKGLFECLRLVPSTVA